MTAALNHNSAMMRRLLRATILAEPLEMPAIGTRKLLKIKLLTISVNDGQGETRTLTTEAATF